MRATAGPASRRGSAWGVPSSRPVSAAPPEPRRASLGGPLLWLAPTGAAPGGGARRGPGRRRLAPRARREASGSHSTAARGSRWGNRLGRRRERLSGTRGGSGALTPAFRDAPPRGRPGWAPQAAGFSAAPCWCRRSGPDWFQLHQKARVRTSKSAVGGNQRYFLANVKYHLGRQLEPNRMAAPSMKERQVCWGARDEYWKCLDENTEDASQCKKLRRSFESSCPQQWVSHTLKFFCLQLKYTELMV